MAEMPTVRNRPVRSAQIIAALWLFFFAAISTASAYTCWYDSYGRAHECNCEDEGECAVLQASCQANSYDWQCYESGLEGGCSAGKCIMVQAYCLDNGSPWDDYDWYNWYDDWDDCYG